jgi:hypothetical protein
MFSDFSKVSMFDQQETPVKTVDSKSAKNENVMANQSKSADSNS